MADLKSGKGGGGMEQNKKTMEHVPGGEKTEAGIHGENTATGPSDVVADTSGVQPLGEKTT